MIARGSCDKKIEQGSYKTSLLTDTRAVHLLPSGPTSGTTIYPGEADSDCSTGARGCNTKVRDLGGAPTSLKLTQLLVSIDGWRSSEGEGMGTTHTDSWTVGQISTSARVYER